MALRTAVRNGRWGDANPLTNAWGAAPPAGADTFATSTFTVTVDTVDGALGCAGGTITAGGTLVLQSTAGFTLTAAVAHNGTFQAIGSGSNVTPTLMTLNGCVWTCGTAAIWNVVGTLPYTAPDVKIVGNATSYFDFVSRTGITGVFTKAELNTFSAVVIFYRMLASNTTFIMSDILFNAIAGTGVFSATTLATIYLTGTIYFQSCSTTVVFALCSVFGDAIILFESTTVNTRCQLASSNFYDTITVNINEAAGASRINGSRFLGNSTLIIANVDSDTCFNGAVIGENAITSLTTATNARIFFRSGINISDGKVTLSCQNGMTLVSTQSVYKVKATKITVTTGAVALTTIFSAQNYWQASRSVSFKIIGSTSIVPKGATTAPQYEPVLYIYDEALYLFGIQYDLDNQCPNYTALYGASTLWTAATKTLAAGGVLRIYSTGHTATGMDMAISSMAGFALATSGTAAWTALYNISFDGGVLWSGDLSLAQLQSNAYTINGNPYTTDPRFDIQIRIKLTSAGGGTITQVRVSGITYDPVVVSSWTVRNELQDYIEGPGFAVANDSLHQISTHKIGVPVALDGGLATLAGNMTKIADDNNGADFDSTTDSLWAISNSVAAIAVVVATVQRYVFWIWRWIKEKIVKIVKG